MTQPAMRYPQAPAAPIGAPAAAAATGGFARAFKRGIGLGNVEVKLGALGRTMTLGSVGDNVRDWEHSPSTLAFAALGTAGAAACAYHGYKRNHSVGWAIVWGLMGSLAPIIAVPVAFAQGFGKRA